MGRVDGGAVTRRTCSHCHRPLLDTREWSPICHACTATAEAREALRRPPSVSPLHTIASLGYQMIGGWWMLRLALGVTLLGLALALAWWLR